MEGRSEVLGVVLTERRVAYYCPLRAEEKVCKGLTRVQWCPQLTFINLKEHKSGFVIVIIVIITTFLEHLVWPETVLSILHGLISQNYTITAILLSLFYKWGN